MNRAAHGGLLEFSPAFADLSPTTQYAISSHAICYHLTPGETLVHQGDASRAFYIIKAGAMRLVKFSTDGHSVTLKVYGPGDVFGLLAGSGTYPSSAAVEAIHPTEVVAIEGDTARDLMLTYPEFALRAVDLLTSHVHHAHKRISQMATMRVEQRLAWSLLELACKFGSPDADGVILVNIPLTLQDLAEFVSTTPETVSRTLSTFKAEGLVEKTRTHIVILDCEGLRVLTE